ncbi:MAG: sugar transferase [bacterium]|nr:sugar transferase [bacterium]
MKRSELVFSVILVPLDYLMLLSAAVAAYFLRLSGPIKAWRPALFTFDLPFSRYFFIAAIVALWWLAAFALAGLYRMKTNRARIEEFFQIVTGSALGVLGIILYIFLTGELFNSRFIILAGLFFAILSVTVSRMLMRMLQAHLAKVHGYGVHRMIIIGGDQVSHTIANKLNSHPDLGYTVVKHLHTLHMDEVRDAMQQNGNSIDEVLLADPNFEKEQVLELIDFCEDKHIGFRFIPNLFQTLTTNVVVDTFTGVPIVELRRTALEGWGKVVKRVLDIGGSILGLVILSPIFLIVAVIVKGDTPGSVFVRLKRVSQGRTFDLYKFRSMIIGAHEMKKELLAYNERQDGPLFKMKNDPRITRVGRWLRKTRIDEFPQLFNVLRGEMSLVGPRPHEPEEVAKYQKHHKKVLAIKPGMTGLAQISGSSDLAFEEEVKLDTYYVENWSLRLDIYILLKTIIVLFTDKSAA